MQSGIFTSSSTKPDRHMLTEALGGTYKYWREIKTNLEKDFGPSKEEWKFYGKNTWWVMKYIIKNKNLFYFTPCDKFFRISFILGDNAVTAVEHSDLPNEIITELKNAKKFVEGRGLHLNVKVQSDVRTVLKIAAIKMKS